MSKVITALVTPFTENGIDYNTLSQLIDYQIDENVDGILILGTTGEAATITPSERSEIIRFCKFYIDNRLELMVGCGSNCTSTACAFAKDAYLLGADSILSVTPYYNKCNAEGVYMHFKKIAECSPLPITLYNVPHRTGFNLTAMMVEKISEIENIVAIKEANGDMFQITDIINNCNIDVYCGEDALTLPILSIGGKGVISVLSNASPRLMKELCNAFDENNKNLCFELNKKVKLLSDAFFCDTNPIPVKAAMQLLGFNTEKLRLPLLSANENVKSKITNVVSELLKTPYLKLH
ncbi:MAG: 4-hydroxy-tetrahydrodipicolinate synthase [Clostridia bacterium]